MFYHLLVCSTYSHDDGWDLEVLPKFSIQYRPNVCRFQLFWLCWGVGLELGRIEYM